MIFSVDHLVFATSDEQSHELRERLELSGFRPEPFHLDFPAIGAGSDSLSFKGGGFVEFVVDLDPRLSPDIWFGDVPRLMGLGFASDAFDSDTWWSSEPAGWEMDEDHVLSDGSRLTIHAAGPHEHLSGLYIFVMDRPDGALQFPSNEDGPRLRELTFAGTDAAVWRENLGRWLNAEPDADGLRVGDVLLRFVPASIPSVHVSPVFEVRSRAGVIDLSQSTLTLQQR